MKRELTREMAILFTRMIWNELALTGYCRKDDKVESYQAIKAYMGYEPAHACWLCEFVGLPDDETANPVSCRNCPLDWSKVGACYEREGLFYNWCVNRNINSSVRSRYARQIAELPEKKVETKDHQIGYNIDNSKKETTIALIKCGTFISWRSCRYATAGIDSAGCNIRLCTFDYPCRHKLGQQKNDQ